MYSLIDPSVHGGLCDGPVGKADGLPHHEAHSCGSVAGGGNPAASGLRSLAGQGHQVPGNLNSPWECPHTMREHIKCKQNLPSQVKRG